MQQVLIDSVKQFGSKTLGKPKSHALVIGDVMLDRYLMGEVGRISPEAPVPVVLIKSEEARAGGAANVAANLALLGISTRLIGCVGSDSEAKMLSNLIKASGVKANLIASKTRPTIAKTRILGGHQQMLRLDQENSDNFTEADTAALQANIYKALSDAPLIVILSDYAKGLLSEPICQQIIGLCKTKSIPVLVDPKGSDYSKYKGATALTPNKKEAAEACGISTQDADLIKNVTTLKNKLGLSFMAVTRGEEGISLIEKNQAQHLPATAQKVFDVSGAGDTVIATLAAGLMHNLTPLQSLELANIAAGVVVGKVGTVPITQADLLEALTAKQGNEQAHKICDLAELNLKVHAWKQAKQKIVFTNGCFDLLHAGHVTYLEAAKKRGDKLILGLNTDRSVSAIKGPSRPVVHENDRARVLAALMSVDAVILFDEGTPLKLIKALKPDVIAKGSDYSANQVVGGKEVQSWGGEIALIELVEGRSTSNIIRKLNT